MAAKKSAKKAKSAKKGATKPVKKIVHKVATKKASKPAVRKSASRAHGKAAKPRVTKVTKSAPALRAKTPAKAAKGIAPKAPVAMPRPGRPARALKQPKQLPPMPAPGLATPPAPLTPALKPAPAPSPKDLAAAHEYLLARSATRSEEPVMVNGKPLLTEGELLKNGEADYMNAEQLAFFKHRLQQMESELLENADQTTEHLRETVIVPDPADRATIEEEHALELRTRDRERKLLKKVQQALGRIESGEYGYCEETGDPIGIPRLLARPTATLSLEAQQRREMKQKMFGD